MTTRFRSSETRRIRLAHVTLAVWAFLAAASEGRAQPPPGQEGGIAVSRRQQLQLRDQLRIDLRAGNEALTSLEARTTKLKEDLDRLLDRAKRIPRRTETREEPPEAETEILYYRPPRRRRTSKNAVGVACQNDRISPIDYQAIGRTVVAVLEARLDGKSPKEQRFGLDISGSDFDFELVVQVAPLPGNQFQLKSVEVIGARKPGNPGETWQEADRPGSRFRRFLAQVDPDELYVEFVVWHDSFDAFLKARKYAWDQGFDTGWGPKEPGERIEMAPGVGVVGQ